MSPKTSHQLRDRPIPIGTRPPAKAASPCIACQWKGACRPSRIDVPETIRLDRSLSIVRADMTAFDENRVGERNPYRFSCRCRILDGRIPSLDRSHTGTFVIGRKDNVIAYSESSRLYSAGYNPALIKSIDVLDSKPQGTVSLRGRRRKPVECAHKGRT